MKSQSLIESLDFLNPPHRQAPKHYATFLNNPAKKENNRYGKPKSSF